MAHAERILNRVLLGKMDFLDVVFNTQLEKYIFMCKPWGIRSITSPSQKRNNDLFAVASKAYSTITPDQLNFLKSICFNSNLTYRDFFIKCWLNSLQLGLNAYVDISFYNVERSGDFISFDLNFPRFTGKCFIFFCPSSAYYYSVGWYLSSILFRGKKFSRRLQILPHFNYVCCSTDGASGFYNDNIPIPQQPPFSLFALAFSDDMRPLGFSVPRLICA